MRSCFFVSPLVGWSSPLNRRFLAFKSCAMWFLQKVIRFRSPVLALMVILLLILLCDFHSNCPHSVQSNSIRFAFQVEKLSRFLLSKCNGRQNTFAVFPGGGWYCLRQIRRRLRFLFGTSQACERLPGDRLLSHPYAGTIYTWAVTVEELIVILGLVSREMVYDLGRTVSPQCLLSLVVRCWQWDP